MAYLAYLAGREQVIKVETATNKPERHKFTREIYNLWAKENAPQSKLTYLRVSLLA